MSSRRNFLMAGAASAFCAARGWAAKTNGTAFPYEEFETRIARRDFRDITKEMLPTPSMVVDLDLFQRNVKQMAEQAKSTGIQMRPHVKVHKSVDVARRQIAQGAIGLTCATIAEAELFSGAGIKNVLWTKQPASVNNIQRAVALSKKDPTFMFVVDDPQVLVWVEQAAAARNARLRIAVSVYAGMDRQGIENGAPAVDLAQKVTASKRAQFEGFMAYSGAASHTKTWAARKKRSYDDLSGVRETMALARQAGLRVNIVSGGSTGTYNMDHEHGLTELEAGSYVFMDTGYFAVGGKDDDKVYNDFKGALTVLTTVDSKRHPNLVTTDYGNKAINRPTDQVKGKPWLQVGTQGAEYGSLRWTQTKT
jgi:D-serine deaminase-like pyridoxal phosphate-dependent protein